jgi:hypothetical protein
MLAIAEDQKTGTRTFNRRYVDWLVTVQDGLNITEALQPLTTVVRMDNVLTAPLAESLARALSGVSPHGGVCRGLLGHVPATVPTIEKLEGEMVNWNHQFGPALPPHCLLADVLPWWSRLVETG